MKFTHTEIPDVILIEPDVHGDDRGFFCETYNREVFVKNGIDTVFVQDNHSRSPLGVLRGLHFQNPPYAQDKLVRVTHGEVYDVAVDLRRGSKTYGKYVARILSGQNKRMLYVPKGFAHGFLTLSDSCDFLYKVSSFYVPAQESGILWNDEALDITWPKLPMQPLLSKKDAGLLKFSDFNSPFGS